ncbi:MAG: RNA polymerase subunit sigma, partial [Verrucomicrobiales bacterium]|nr:RNA polymerase subunit sigma [Verrucomicrobiales bacterium]
AARHGGGWLRVDLPDFEPASAGDATPDDTVAALGEALDHLATTHPRHAEIVQLRFFAGLTLEQAAAVVGISVPTAKRDWAFARAWLFRQLQRSREEDRGT